MSSDQQYPYGQQPHPADRGPYPGPYPGPDDPYQGYPEYPGHQQPTDAQATHARSAYQQQPSHPQPTHQPPTHQHQPYAPQDPYSGGNPYQQQPYQQQTPYGVPQPQPYGQPQAYPQPAPVPQEGAAQTWEGETWDTSYQPVLRSEPPAPHGAAPGHADGQTAYLPPVTDGPAGYGTPAAGGPHNGTGGRPLPPEAPAAPYEQAPAPAPAPPAPPTGPDGYTTPTTGGAVRLTAAQRARAEGRSPIIPPGIQPAAVTAGLSLLLAVGAAIHTSALLVPLVLLQAVTAAGWFRLNGMWPARQGIALAFAGALVSDAALLAAGRENAPTAILGTLGVWVLIGIVLTLRSRASSDERMSGLMATVVSAALAILATAYLAAPDKAVVAGVCAVAAATVVRALPARGPVSVAASLLAGGAVGAATAGMLSLGAADGGVLGVSAAVLALIGLRVASYDYPSRFVHFTAGLRCC
ncbi:integral membrane protein [Streptomyces clavuligerus]|nr:integral membrane protein [Streptomyces clavuligerus]